MDQPKRQINPFIHTIFASVPEEERKLVEKTVKKRGDNTRKFIYTTNLGMLVQDCRKIARIEKEELMEILTKISKNG